MTFPRSPPCSGRSCSVFCRRWPAPRRRRRLRVGHRLPRPDHQGRRRQGGQVRPLRAARLQRGDKAYPLILFPARFRRDRRRRQEASGHRPRAGHRECRRKRSTSRSSSSSRSRRSAPGRPTPRTANAPWPSWTRCEKDYKIDAKRLYLTGLSMGGFGTWSLAAKYPDRWAAIVPICGGGDPSERGRRSRTFPAGSSTATPTRPSRSRSVAADDRRPEGSRRQAEVHRISRRRPQQLGQGVWHAGTVRLVAATAQVSDLI